MCGGCWERYECQQIDTPQVREAAKLIRELYDDHDEIVGGMLHVQLDDWNIDDAFWVDPFEPYLIELHGREPLPVERKIVEVMAAMSEENRASALALADGHWEREAKK